MDGFVQNAEMCMDLMFKNVINVITKNQYTHQQPQYIMEVMRMGKDDKLKLITKYFGIETELTKLSEEVGELLNACYKYYFTGKDINNIEDELADVLVIFTQLCIYFNVDMDKVENIAKSKIDRTVERIEAGWYDKHR